jgi:hypothetical protein
MIFVIIATLLLSLPPATAIAQEINILGAGRGWKLQPQRGPDGQNVYSFDCGAEVRHASRHRVSHRARHSWMVGR